LRIIIDGLSCTRSKEISKKVAEHYSITFIDTGILYRSLALFLVQNGVSWTQYSKKLVTNINRMRYTHYYRRNEVDVSINGLNYSKSVNKVLPREISRNYAEFEDVKFFLSNYILRNFSNISAVILGKDLGSYLFSKEKIKIFIVANKKSRKKWLSEYFKKNNCMFDEESIDHHIEVYDSTDIYRSIQPLKKSKNAKNIDVSELSVEEASKKIIKYVNRVYNQNKGNHRG